MIKRFATFVFFAYTFATPCFSSATISFRCHEGEAVVVGALRCFLSGDIERAKDYFLFPEEEALRHEFDKGVKRWEEMFSPVKNVDLALVLCPLSNLHKSLLGLHVAALARN